jgi:hypothetical protein
VGGKGKKGRRDPRETGRQAIFHPKLFLYNYNVRRPPSWMTRGGFLTSGLDLLYFLIVNFSVPCKIRGVNHIVDLSLKAKGFFNDRFS